MQCSITCRIWIQDWRFERFYRLSWKIYTPSTRWSYLGDDVPTIRHVQWWHYGCGIVWNDTREEKQVQRQKKPQQQPTHRKSTVDFLKQVPSASYLQTHKSTLPIISATNSCLPLRYHSQMHYSREMGISISYIIQVSVSSCLACRIWDIYLSTYIESGIQFFFEDTMKETWGRKTQQKIMYSQKRKKDTTMDGQ